MWVLARSPSVFPSGWEHYWLKADAWAATLFGEQMPLSHPVRQAVAGYEHLTGIESGYGFFAPNVTDNYRLVFELRYPDGHTQYDLPSVASDAAGLRFASLLDKIGRTGNDELHELMIKMLCLANLKEHPEANQIRATFTEVALPTVEQYRRGEESTEEVLAEYEFERQKRAVSDKE